MSAFIVSKKHIDALLTYAARSRSGRGALYYYWQNAPHYITGEIDRIGQVLVGQNYRSVNYRYNTSEPIPAYRYNFYYGELTPAKIIKACDCYNYQACETEDYEKTEAYEIIDTIRELAISEMTDGDDTWEIIS